MREIKFRARLDKIFLPKSFDKGWVYGYVSKNLEGEWHIDTAGNDGKFVGNGQYLAIDGETIGEFTGLKDKNGSEIYEGDIVKRTYESGSEFIGEVVFEDATYFMRSSDEYSFLASQYNSEEVEIIGNIHEHSHLLEDAT